MTVPNRWSGWVCDRLLVVCDRGVRPADHWRAALIPGLRTLTAAAFISAIISRPLGWSGGSCHDDSELTVR